MRLWHRLIDRLDLPTQRAYTVRGRTFRMSLVSRVERWRAATWESKEPETLDWLDRHLRHGDVFYDVGANIGLYSLYAAARCQETTVYAFEPAPANMLQICRNVVLNGLGNVRPMPFAVAGHTGLDDFWLYDLGAGAAFHSTGRANPWRDEPPVLTHGIMAVTLDDLPKHGVPAPTLMKIDVDGLEDDILRAGAATLRDPRLRSVLIEMEDGQSDAPLTDAGLVLTVVGPMLRYRAMVCRNQIYERH